MKVTSAVLAGLLVVATATGHAAGESVLFCATGVTDGEMLRGVRFNPKGAVTESIVMRARSRTIRWIKSQHHFDYKPKYL